MRLSAIVPRTRRTAPREARTRGTELLLRAGAIDLLEDGRLLRSSLALEARRAAERLLRALLDRAGAIELDPEGGPAAWRALARRYLRTHRDLPARWFRIEHHRSGRPRAGWGLLHTARYAVAELLAADGSAAGLRASAELGRRLLLGACGALGVRVEAVEGAGAPPRWRLLAQGVAGGEAFLVCDRCGHGDRAELACAWHPPPAPAEDELHRLATPGVGTVEGLQHLTGLPPERMVKTIVLVADGEPVVVSLRGDLELGAAKLRHLLGVERVEVANAGTVERVTGAPVGFAGPVGLFGRTRVPYLFDRSVQGLRGFLCGANEADLHLTGVDPERDLPPIERFEDLSLARGGMACGLCRAGALETRDALELGVQEPWPLPGKVRDAGGESRGLRALRHQLGLDRIVQAAVEQRADQAGIRWPFALAPFQVVVIPAVAGRHLPPSEALHARLHGLGLRALLDDRPARIGEKLTDAELQGWPVQVLLGRAWESGRQLEVRLRDPDLAPDDPRFRPAPGGPVVSALMTADALLEFLAEKRRSP